MKGKKLLVGFAVLALTASGGVAANEIYKWTDEDGNVHYEDRPSDAVRAERLAMTYKPTNSTALDKRMEAFAESKAARQEARAAANVEAQEAQKAEAEAEARQERCAKYRSQLEGMLQAPRLYRQGEDGEREYLDDTQRQEARTRAEELIAKNCS